MRAVVSVISVVVVVAAAASSAGCARAIGDGAGTAPTVSVIGPSLAFVGDVVDFDSAVTDDGDGIASFTWAFGDGATAVGPTANHAFASPGGFVVTLTAVDEDGETGAGQLVLTVEGLHPSASVSVSATSAPVLAEVTFDASASTGPAPIAGYAWSFGDGANGAGAVVTHAFTRTGTFHVELTVTDEDAAFDVGSVDVTVTPIDITGVWSIAASPSSYSCASYDAVFPDSALVIAADDAGTVTATGGNGRTYTGTLDGASLTLAGSTSLSAGGCGTAPVDLTMNLDLDGVGALTGNATAYFDLEVGCQCSAGFAITATR